MPVQKPAKSAKPAAVAGEKTVSLPAAKAATKASTVSTPKSKAQLLKEAADELLKNAEAQEKKKPARKPKATADADAAEPAKKKAGRPAKAAGADDTDAKPKAAAKITASGTLQLSYSAAKHKNTNTIEST